MSTNTVGVRVPSQSIYVPRDDKFTGGSPQVMWESFWAQGRETRLKRRGVLAGVGLVCGILLAIRFSLSPFLIGLLGAGVAAGGDALFAWHTHESTAVWRGKRRGEVRTGRILRRSLRRHGYSVLDGRAVPGQASIDHLVIGPGGVWIVDNEAWGPDLDLARYGTKLFIGERSGSKVAKGLTDAASSLAGLLSRESGVDVTISSLLAVHGGTILPDGHPRGTVTAEGLTLAYPRRVAWWIKREKNADLTDEQVELLTRTAARILRRMSAV